MALSDTEKELARKASFGDDIMAQREAAAKLSDMRFAAPNDTESTASLPTQEPADTVPVTPPTWEEATAAAQVEPPSWNDAVRTLEKDPKIAAMKAAQDEEVLKNIPDYVQVLGLKIPAPKETVAAFIGAGHGMTWAYRGIKQLLNIDEESMANEQRAMEALYNSDNLAGKMAKGGQVFGSLYEPAGLLIPAAKAKSVTVAAAKGFSIGAVYSGLGYVDKERGQTRMGNMLLGGTLGGTFTGVFTGAVLRAEKKQIQRAAASLDDYELKYAQELLRNPPKTIDDLTAIPKNVVAQMPKDFNLSKSSSITGRMVKPPANSEQAKEIVRFYKDTAKQSDLKLGVDTVIGIVSTRVGNMSKSIKGGLRKHDFLVSKTQHEHFKEVDTFLSKYSKAFGKNAPQKAAIDAALRNGDFGIAKRKLMEVGGPELVAEFAKVERTLDKIGNQALELGLITEKLPNYFPRYITDHTKLISRLGIQERSALLDALNAATLKAADKGKQLSAVDKSDIINKVMRGYTPKGVGTSGGPFTKQRAYKKIPHQLQEFYSTPEESIHSYIRNMVNDIERAKFFGKNLKKIKTGSAELFDVDASVGALLKEEMAINPMSNTELKELSGLLQTRFGIGERSPTSIVQNAKNLMYAALIANPVAAATQLGDLGVSVYVNGFKNTLASLTTKKYLTVKDWGLTDQLAEEFATTSGTARMLRRAFKLSGFAAMDKLGKDVHINSAYRRLTKQVSTAKGEAAFRKKYSEYLGADLEQTISGLKNKVIDTNVEALLFGELADIQPLSLSEVPELYLRLPNGRVGYMLKTFMLKQVDILRRDAYNEIKKGNVAKGLYNGAKYSVIMGAAGTGSNLVKNTLLYGPTDQDIPIPTLEELPAEFGMNMLKTFGWSEYVGNKIKDGKPVEAALDAFAPPFEIVDKILQADENSVDYMPIYGKLYHYWFNGGARAAIERKEARERKKEYEDILGTDTTDYLDEYDL